MIRFAVQQFCGLLLLPDISLVTFKSSNSPYLILSCVIDEPDCGIFSFLTPTTPTQYSFNMFSSSTEHGDEHKTQLMRGYDEDIINKNCCVLTNRRLSRLQYVEGK